MRLCVIIGLWVAFCAQPALAGQYRGCTPAQSVVIESAIDDAKDMALRAAGAVGDTPQFSRWFGSYTTLHAEKARASLKSIVAVIRSGTVDAQCDPIVGATSERVGCAEGEFAWVFADEPYLLHVCPAFFELPTMAEIAPRSSRSVNGSRAGTIIHELSHFLSVAETEDHCYTRRDCALMAHRDPNRAIENADSYQYFAEDVTYYARQRFTDKPAPAQQPKR